MCWKNKVRVDIGRDEDPQKFMKVESDEFVLAIPEFTKKARMYGEPIDADTSGILTAESIAEVAHFKKIIMKLSGNLRWLVGLKFEQDLGGPGSWKERPRSFNFIPHYDITLKDPQYATTADGEVCLYGSTLVIGTDIGRYMTRSRASEATTFICRCQ